MKVKLLIGLLFGYAGAACAQGSVTLYGIIDNEMTYQNSATTVGSTSDGHSAIKMNSGAWNGSRFGMRGSEELGGGTKIIFNLESGFSSATGALGYTNGLFSREAVVGIANPAYGTVTTGRTYTAYYLLLSNYSPTLYLSGFYGAHPGDIDSLDTGYRANNSVVYMSPNIHGLKFGASYAFGGVPGSVNAGSTWSAGALYSAGPVGVAAAVQRINNSTPGGGVWGANTTTTSGGTQSDVSAINSGYQTAQAQQRIALDADYKFSSAWDLSVSYSNVQYIPGINSAFRSTAIFNTAGAVLHYQATPALSLATGYSYTRATKANGITDPATYNQITFAEFYNLSKRTGVYAAQAYQRASGSTLVNGQAVTATASVGDGFNGSPSSTRNQLIFGVGVVHKF